MSLNQKIFKTYDIRGEAGVELTRESAELIGLSLGTYFQHICGQKQVVVGADMRLSSGMLFKGLVKGLTGAGCDVSDIGLVATPVLYTQAYALGMAGVMITGSHLAKEFNGFKIVIGLKPVFGDSIATIGELIKHGVFETGKGRVREIDDVNVYYVDRLISSFRRGRTIHAVVDGGNGMGGYYAAAILRQLGHHVTELYTEPDGNFPNHHPNPEKEENLTDLIAKVQETGADVGLAFDGDADRVGVVDENGNYISADKVMAWLATDILPRHREGAIFVGDVLSSQVVFETVEQFGGEAVMWASGHARIKAKMQEIGALFGGESSGHMFFADRYPGFDDGIYAAGRIVELLAESHDSLSEHIAGLPQYFTTPEYRPHCPEELKQSVIDGVKARLDGTKVVDVDGLRVIFSDGWGLLRPSGTEPVLSLRFEAKDEATALSYKQQVVSLLREVYPEVENF